MFKKKKSLSSLKRYCKLKSCCLAQKQSFSSVLVAGSQTKSQHFTSCNMLYCCRLFQMMKHAWDSYRQYGWGHNELKPLAKKGHSTNIFGRPDEPLCPHDSLCQLAVCSHTGARTNACCVAHGPTRRTLSPCLFSCGQGCVMTPPAGCMFALGGVFANVTENTSFSAR